MNVQLFTKLVAVVVSVGSLYLAYLTYQLNIQQNEREAKEPTKELTWRQRYVSYPLSSLKQLHEIGGRVGGKLDYSFMIQGRPLTNIAVADYELKNEGKLAIQPADYFEKISVQIEQPWEILAVRNWHSVPAGIDFTWTKVTSQKYDAAPALLNPGDQVYVSVYLTNPSLGDAEIDALSSYLAGAKKASEPKLVWRARITGLQSFSEGSKSPYPGYEKELEKQRAYLKQNRLGPIVFMAGWHLLLVIAVFSVLFPVTLYLLLKAGYKSRWPLTGLLTVTAVALLSFATAEVIGYYSFYPFPIMGFQSASLSYEINIPILTIHAGLLLYLCRRVYKRYSSVPVHAPPAG